MVLVHSSRGNEANRTVFTHICKGNVDIPFFTSQLFALVRWFSGWIDATIFIYDVRYFFRINRFMNKLLPSTCRSLHRILLKRKKILLSHFKVIARKKLTENRKNCRTLSSRSRYPPLAFASRTHLFLDYIVFQNVQFRIIISISVPRERNGKSFISVEGEQCGWIG